ncbi:MAG TPA: TetR/AcrR family transcriptional regulator [Acidimicrobiales bacterium]|nr:TetR/AcrR family transcriptional regulator [Acidimicrobiales bacterium]
MASTTTPRERLLEAARQVVARDGVGGLTLRAIAREAGVSHGAPLRHFPTLASLLAAVSAGGFEQLIASVADAIDGEDDPRRRIAAAGHGYVRFALAQPGVYAVMFRPDLSDTSDPAYQAAGLASFEQLAGLVADAQADGWHPDVPRDQVAAVLWANVHGLADLWLHGALQSVLTPDALTPLLDLSTTFPTGTDP